MFKVIKNKDGKFETVSTPDPEDQRKTLEELHKEVREMIEGNRQFHDDPYKAPAEKVDHVPIDDTDDSAGFPEYFYQP